MFIMIGSAIAAVLVLAGAMVVLIRRNKKESTDEDMAVALSKIEEASEIADIDIEDKNELKKKIEKFISQKPDQVAQLLKTWLTEE